MGLHGKNKNESQVLNRLVVPGLRELMRVQVMISISIFGTNLQRGAYGGHNLDLSMSLVMLLGASDQVW